MDKIKKLWRQRVLKPFYMWALGNAKKDLAEFSLFLRIEMADKYPNKSSIRILRMEINRCKYDISRLRAKLSLL